MMDCPAEDIGLCRCKQDLKIFHSKDASYYPKAGFFRIGRKLYNGRRVGAGRHFWEGFISNHAWVIKAFVRFCGEHQFCLYAAIQNREVVMDVIMTVNAMINRLPPVMHVWRIQRQMRRFLQCKAEIEQRRLTALMALHPRLGCQSRVACLPEDVLLLILNQ